MTALFLIAFAGGFFGAAVAIGSGILVLAVQQHRKAQREAEAVRRISDRILQAFVTSAEPAPEEVN